MGHTHEGPPKGGTYLLTEDFIDKIETFRHCDIKTMGFNSSVYPELQDRLAAALQDALPSDARLLRVKMHKLAGRVIGFIDAKWAEEDVLVVSTCPEFRYPSRGSSIQVNRIVDAYGESLGIGPRPGRPSLDRQLEKIEQDARGRPIVLAEDGVFSGGTLDFIFKALDDAGLKIAGVVTGFNFAHGSNEVFEDRGIDLDVIHEGIDNLIDWVPDHDFLPFIPGCGKVLGARVGGLVQPFYDHNGASFSLPYVAPFGNVHKWAGIPEENVETFSRECMLIARDLYVALDGLNQAHREPLTVRDVVHASAQRISIPIKLLANPVEDEVGAKIVLPQSEVGIVKMLDGYLS